MVTYNQIISILSEIASNHSQIENFGNGDLWEVVQHNQNSDFQYPMLWVEDAPMSFNEKEFQYTFNVYVFDRSNRDRVQDKEHENDVKSDMLQIGLGVLAMLHNEYDETFIDVVKSHSFESFTERLDDTLTGWRFTVSLSSPFDYDACSEPFTGNGSTFGACDPVIVYASDGTTVLATIPSGGSYTVSSTQSCDDATAVLKNTDGTTISSTDIPSGASQDIIAPDATADLQNTDGTTISTTAIPAGDSEIITAPDATFSINGTQVATIPSGDSDSIQVRKESGSDQIGSLQGQHWRIDDSVITLKDTANNTLSTTNVPATEAEDITAPDGTVNVNKSDSTLISAQTVLSNGTTNYNVADSTAVLKDTAGATLSTTAIKATESEDITAPDATVTVNDSAYGSAPSNGSLDVDVEYSDGTDVGTVSGSIVEIPDNRYNSANPYKTGQTTSYASGDDGDLERGRGSDFTTLDFNNPFGNTNRFTDTTGAQTYANDIVIDWASADYVNETVLGWYRIEQGGGGVNWSTAISATPQTIGGFTNFYLPNAHEMSSLINHGLVVTLNYAPLNLSTGVNRYWTSTSSANAPTAAQHVTNTNGQMFANAKTSTWNYILVRTFTFTELGL